MWRDRTGRQIGSAEGANSYGSPSISPDGRKVAFGRFDEGNWDIWIQEFSRNTLSRFTTEPDIDTFAIWSPQGDTIAFAGSLNRILRKAVDGGPTQEIVSGGSRHILRTNDWSGDGRLILLSDANDLLVLPLTGGGKLVPLFTTPFTELHGRFSPSSVPPRWFAYDSNESGRPEVYVQAFTWGSPASGMRWQVSANGGREPRWRGDGKRLFYISADQRMMAVDVDLEGAMFTPGTPVPLFETPAQQLSTQGWSYDVTRDGERFVLAKPLDPSGPPMAVIVNWQAALKK